MGKIFKGALVTLAGAVGTYYFKNPEKIKEHKESLLENLKCFCNKAKECSDGCCPCSCEDTKEDKEDEEVYVKLKDSSEVLSEEVLEQEVEEIEEEVFSEEESEVVEESKDDLEALVSKFSEEEK